MRPQRRAVHVVMLVLAIVGVMRFAQRTRSVDVVGLVACGALAGISVARLLSK